MSHDVPGRSAIRKAVPLAFLVLAGGLFLLFGGWRYLTLAALAANGKWLVATVGRAGAAAAAAFVVGYALLVALWFPAAELLTITAGFLFGRWFGTLYAVIGATAGATIVFLAVRAGVSGLAFRAHSRTARLAAGFRRHGFNYLLFLRFLPIVPFWLVNIVAGAAGLKLRTFIAGTLIGIVPGAFVYASLGVGLGQVLAAGRRPDIAILFRPGIFLPLLGLAALALLPVIYRHWHGRQTGP